MPFFALGEVSDISCFLFLTRRIITCCKVNVVLFLRCFLRRNPSSKSAGAWLPKPLEFTEKKKSLLDRIQSLNKIIIYIFVVVFLINAVTVFERKFGFHV